MAPKYDDISVSHGIILEKEELIKECCKGQPDQKT